MPDLSIIIVNWNTCDLLGDCLQSIADCRLQIADNGASPGSGHPSTNLPTIEIIVIDNASTDGSAAMVRERFPWVTLIENGENVGFARANNQAIRQARGRYILLLNPDTVIKPGALNAMIAYLDTHQQVGVMGPKLLDGHGNVQLSWADFPTLRSELFTGHQRHPTPPLPIGDAYEVDWLAGACMLVRREVIDAVGLMDERFFLYSEETDWCLRIQRAGWQIVYYPAAAVAHMEGSSTALDEPRANFLLYHSKLLYFDKHYGRTRAQILRFGFVALAPMKALKSWLHGRPNTARSHLRIAYRLLTSELEPISHA